MMNPFRDEAVELVELVLRRVAAWLGWTQEGEGGGSV